MVTIKTSEEEAYSAACSRAAPRCVRLSSLLPVLRPGKAIDLACGGCVIADILKEHGFDLDLIDIEACRIPKRWKGRFTEGDAKKVDLEPYEWVIFAGFLYHLSIDSQKDLCAKLKGHKVIVDTWVCPEPGRQLTTDYKGRKRPSTKSSEKFPTIPTWKTLQNVLFPDHVLWRADNHRPDRCWFVATPRIDH